MVKRKKTLLITENFPYLPGEQFLEEEVIYWHKFNDVALTILPIRAEGAARELPPNIQVSNDLSRKLPSYATAFLFLRAVFSSVFVKEISYLVSVRKLRTSCVRTALKTTYDTFRLRKLLKGHLKNSNDKPLVYTYWFNTAFYAAALLKKEDWIGGLISRAHRFDVYENFRSNQYMPIKRQFVDGFDRLSAISDKGRAYLCDTYGIAKGKVTVDRLGVELPVQSSPAAEPMKLVLLSVSYCIGVKNIHKIIEAVGIASKTRTNVTFIWHHIGDGPLRTALEDLAVKELTAANVSWSFHGNLQNADVKGFFEKNAIDVFINTSQSEGVPVSIMEAMSYGVPAIAPDVGGISEIINSNHGVLLSNDPSPAEISEALILIDFFKNDETRLNAKKHVEAHYNAKVNYREFIDSLSSLAR